MPLSRGSTRGRYSRIVGVTVGNQSHSRLRSPLLDRIADVVESRTKSLISESRILFTPRSLRRSSDASGRRSFDFSLLKFHGILFRITRVSLNRSNILVTRTLFLVPPDI